MTRTLSLSHHRHTLDQRVPDPDDGALAQRAQGTDRDAFEALYRAYAARVYALCLRLTADVAQANELTQDVFIRAWKALPDFRGEAEIATWLHRIAVNAMLQQRRGDRRREARVALAEDRDEDARALERGSTSAHDVEGFTHVEIAEMTGLAEGTLRAQLHRARQLLIEALRP